MSPASRAKAALALKARGNKLYSSKQYEQAVKLYSKAIECEEQAVFYSNRAACYTNLNQLDKVVDDCSDALRLDPSYIKALNRRATAREQIGGVENLYQALCGERCLLHPCLRSSSMLTLAVPDQTLPPRPSSTTFRLRRRQTRSSAS